MHVPGVFSGKRTKAGDVPVQSDVLQVPLGSLRLGGVGLRHVVHGEHRLLTELCVVVKVDFGVEANHLGERGRCWKGSHDRGDTEGPDGQNDKIVADSGTKMCRGRETDRKH